MGRFIPIIAVLVVCLAAQQAAACPGCSASAICTLPGLGVIGAYVGLVLPILSAFLKQPFFRRAGVTSGGLAIALQAAALATLVSAVTGLAGVMLLWSLPPAGLAYVAGFVAFTTWLDHTWACRRTRQQLPWRPFVVANVVTAFGIAILSAFHSPFDLGTGNSGWIGDNIGWVASTTAIISLAVLLGAFGWRTYTATPPEQKQQRGFDVIPTAEPAAS